MVPDQDEKYLRKDLDFVFQKEFLSQNFQQIAGCDAQFTRSDWIWSFLKFIEDRVVSNNDWRKWSYSQKCDGSSVFIGEEDAVIIQDGICWEDMMLSSIILWMLMS